MSATKCRSLELIGTALVISDLALEPRLNDAARRVMALRVADGLSDRELRADSDRHGLSI